MAADSNLSRIIHFVGYSPNQTADITKKYFEIRELDFPTGYVSPLSKIEKICIRAIAGTNVPTLNIQVHVGDVELEIAPNIYPLFYFQIQVLTAQFKQSQKFMTIYDSQLPIIKSKDGKVFYPLLRDSDAPALFYLPSNQFTHILEHDWNQHLDLARKNYEKSPKKK